MTLSEVFAANDVTCAHVIDDAYDSAPSTALDDAEIQAFLDDASDEDLGAVAERLGVPNDERSIRDALAAREHYAALYETDLGVTAGAREALFGTFEKYRQGKRDLIEPLIILLRKEGLNCVCFGANYDPVGHPAPQLLFIDLKLNDTNPVVDHRDAVRVLSVMRSKFPESKPFVFLMSSLSTYLPLQREPFREEAQLFQSEFESIEKASFGDAKAVEMMLAGNTRAMPKIIALRSSVERLEPAMSVCFQNVMKELRALDLADYFNLYHNTTSAEGTTVGSYMVELLLEFLAHEVEGTPAIWDLYRGIEALDVQRLPRARFGLSTPAAALYSGNMLHSAKRLLAEESLERGPSNGYFYLGDIFCDAQWMNTPLPARAYAVVTPACDTARPEEMAGMNLLLCAGQVTEFIPGEIPNKRDALATVVMPNPRDTGKYVLINWDKKQISMWGDEERAKYNTAECSYVRVGRLRPMYAIQLQHAIYSNLGRIGTQRPPSILVPRQVRCYVSDGVRWKVIFKSDGIDAGALAESTDDRDTFVTFILSDPAVFAIVERLAAWVAEHARADKADVLARVAGETVVDALQGFRYKVPKPDRGKHDVTAFPLESVDGIGKVVAFVSSRLVPTPFEAVRNMSKTKKGRDVRLLVVFETDVDALEPEDAGQNAAGAGCPLVEAIAIQGDPSKDGALPDQTQGSSDGAG